MLRLILLCLVLLLAPPATAGGRITVFAAASLQESLDAIADLWSQRSGQTVVVSYAASSALARQIEQGAPADIFVSADLEWMDYLQSRRLIDPATRVRLARNQLVVIVPVGTGTVALALEADALEKALGPQGRLALAETVGVPAGRYARQALEALGLWPTVADRRAEADSVRAAMAFVARGEAPLGVVYATDAKVEPRVRVVAELPASSHAPIVYPAARVAAARAARADGFLLFLSGPEARAVFEHAGFDPP
jgi:molybdate transport system substrate-binding protein